MKEPKIRLSCGHLVPEREILAAAGRIQGERRRGKPGGRVGGRPVVLRACPHCLAEFPAVQMRAHLPRCPARAGK